ncbi:MAG: tetratricopeptide repeat protein [Planctomycetota bacterium]
MMQRLWAGLAIGAVAAMGTAGSAQAQVAAGGNGQALDANLQVGSGGVNQLDPNQNIDYAARNNLITGNVAGGRGFQGNVPYSAPGEFGFNRSSLPTNSFFSFSANALPSAPGVQGAAIVGQGTDSTVGVFGTFDTLRPGTSFDAVPYRSTAAGIGEVVRYVPTSTLGGLPATQTLGVARRADGQLTQLIASPLLGVRQAPIDVGEALTPARPVDSGVPRIDPGEQEDAEANVGQGEVTTRVIPQSIDADGQVILGEPGLPVEAVAPTGDGLGAVDLLDYRLGYYAGRSPLTAPAETDAIAAEPAPGSPLGLMLGRQLRREFDPTVSAAGVTADRLAAESARLAEVDAADDIDPDDNSPYAQLLRAARERAQGSASADTAADDMAAGPDTLDAPSTDAIDQAEDARRQALMSLLGDDELTTTDTSPNLIRDAGVGDLLNLIDYDLPAIDALSDENDARLREVLESAASSLASGAYVDAERQYTQALRLAPDDPLVRIGLVHAQLGAGMFRSAAFNLRRVFAKHPEIIAARYAARLLPPQRRLEEVSTELQRIATVPRSASDAGLLLAYLGYLSDSPTLVRFGLATSEANDPRQDLMPLLREVWLDEPSDD